MSIIDRRLCSQMVYFYYMGNCCVFCAECSMNVHHKCQKKVANLCGVNQKLMAEALAIIETKQQVRQTNPLFFQNVFGGIAIGESAFTFSMVQFFPLTPISVNLARSC